MLTCYRSFPYTFMYQQRAPEWINWFREAELKHGRQAMLATVGLVVPEFVRIPGEQFSFEAIPNVINAHDALIDTSMKQILLWISLWEAMTFGALSNMGEFDRQPGDWSFDPLGLKPSDPEELKKMQLKELKNGRLVSTQVNERHKMWVSYQEPFTHIILSFFIYRQWLLLEVWYTEQVQELISHTSKLLLKFRDTYEYNYQ